MLEFIETNADKKPINRHKTYSSFEGLENAGLLLNDNVVVVDFDNDNKNENKIIEYIDNTYNTLKVITDKGVHFYYSKPTEIPKIKSNSDVITVGGFQADYKTGNQYALVKRYGKARETNRPLTLDNLPELPSILYPLTRRKDNLSGMVERRWKK